MYEVSEGNPFTIFLICRMMVGKLVHDNRYDKIYQLSKQNFSGESFMLHPDILIFNAYKYEYTDIAQYIGLCSLRPYVDYQATGKIHLDLLSVDIDQELFNENRLLRIEDDIVHFKYEEVPKEKIH